MNRFTPEERELVLDCISFCSEANLDALIATLGSEATPENVKICKRASRNAVLFTEIFDKLHD